LGVQATQDSIGDLRELRDLVGSQGVDHVLAHERDVSGRRVLDLRPPVLGEACVGGPPVLGTRELFDEAAALKSLHQGVADLDALLVPAAGEFAHLHPAHDGSLHLALPPAQAADAIAKGWAIAYPSPGPAHAGGGHGLRAA